MKVDQIEIGAENAQIGKKLYQGLAKLAPTAVNPTAAELGKLLGTSIEKEPVYGTDDVMRLDFWCKITEVDKWIKVPIFISNEDVVSKAGNFQWINAYGQNGWFKDKAAIEAKNAAATEEWQKIKLDGLRIAKKGEVVVYDFLMKTYNASTSKPFPLLENWKKLTTGNVKELKEVLESIVEKDRHVHALLGVKDGKYQDVYTAAFLPAVFTARAEQYFTKNASDKEYGFKSTWDDNLKFREYSLEPAPEATEVEDGLPVVDDLPWGNSPTPTKMF